MTHGSAWRLLVIGMAACTACAPAVKTPSTPQGRAEVEALAREALANLDRATPEPPACSRGWAESASGYVVAVGEWAEQAGLRPGDRIVEVGGAPVTTAEERARAYARVPPGGPFDLAALRQGHRLTLALPCRHQPQLFRAERRTLEAAARGDWEGCVAAARDTRRLAGYTAYPNVIWEHACTRAKTPSTDAPGGAEFVSLSYETARLLLRDSGYVPGGTTQIRETIRQIADDLRRSGAATQADDLEGRYRAAVASLPRLEVAWADNTTDEDGYLVERKIAGTGQYLPLATLPPNTVTYVDTSVEMGVIYCYRVKVFKASSYSEPSNEACATPNPPAPPGGGR